MSLTGKHTHDMIAKSGSECSMSSSGHCVHPCADLGEVHVCPRVGFVPGIRKVEGECGWDRCIGPQAFRVVGS